MNVRHALATAILLAGYGPAAGAVDLVNSDRVAYEVHVTENGTTATTTLKGRSTKLGICHDCTIAVEGVGSITATDRDRVLVKDGQLSKQTPAPNPTSARSDKATRCGRALFRTGR